MTADQIQSILEKQRAYFHTGTTLPVDFRLDALKKLKAEILRREDAINAAIKADLGKSAMESYMCETGLTVSEISHMTKHLRRYAREHRVLTPLPQYLSRSFKKPSPKGNVLIMSPWNYPFLLTMEPLVDALAAGNTAIVKPSAYSPATSALMAEIIAACFPEEYVACVTGGRAENTALLEQKFDHIFFTGSQAVGREVLRHAAPNLTPVTLELGGKSPCLVDSSAKLQLAARRIVFGKYLNCGQTCVAPDYVICERSIQDQLVAALKQETISQYEQQPLENPDYGHIVSKKHYDRILGLIDPAKTVLGGTGNPDTLQIAPTIMTDVTWNDPIMQQEIFGPVLPILTVDSLDEVPALLADRQKPLAFYLFSEDRGRIRALTAQCSFGGSCINDTIIHLATSNMGFGGVGESGMGSYHGKAGFDTFSHTKSIVDKKTILDLPMRYQPYKSFNDKLIHMFLR